MSVKDIESKLNFIVALSAVIGSNTTTSGAILDTAAKELGTVFILNVPVFTDGSYELQIFESDDAAMAGATQVVAPKILPTINANDSITEAAVVAEGATLQKIGVFSNKRYLQARVVSTGVTTGATVNVIATQAPELTPTD